MLNQQQCQSNGFNGLAQQANMQTALQPELSLDADVKRVLSFIMSSVEVSKCVSVAEAVAQLAPLLWGHHERTELRALSLSYPPITSLAGRIPPAAI